MGCSVGYILLSRQRDWFRRLVFRRIGDVLRDERLERVRALIVCVRVGDVAERSLSHGRTTGDGDVM